MTDAGYEQAGLAFIIEREVDVGKVKERHVLKAQGDMPGAAHGGIVVEVDAACAQLPVDIVGVASGIAGVSQAGEAGSVAQEQTRLTVGVAWQIAIAGLGECADFAVQVQVGAIALDVETAMLVGYLAAGAQACTEIVVEHALGAQALPPALDPHIAT